MQHMSMPNSSRRLQLVEVDSIHLCEGFLRKLCARPSPQVMCPENELCQLIVLCLIWTKEVRMKYPLNILLIAASLQIKLKSLRKFSCNRSSFIKSTKNFLYFWLFDILSSFLYFVTKPTTKLFLASALMGKNKQIWHFFQRKTIIKIWFCIIKKGSVLELSHIGAGHGIEN